VADGLNECSRQAIGKCVVHANYPLLGLHCVAEIEQPGSPPHHHERHLAQLDRRQQTPYINVLSEQGCAYETFVLQAPAPSAARSTSSSCRVRGSSPAIKVPSGTLRPPAASCLQVQQIHKRVCMIQKEKVRKVKRSCETVTPWIPEAVWVGASNCICLQGGRYQTIYRRVNFTANGLGRHIRHVLEQCSFENMHV